MTDSEAPGFFRALAAVFRWIWSEREEDRAIVNAWRRAHGKEEL